jgi:hypothetical protein
MTKDKVVGELIKGFSNKSIEMAKEAVSKDAVSNMGKKDLNLKISYFVTDEDTKKYIKELDLDNPQKLAMFLVEVGFSSAEIVIGSINEIKIDMMNDLLGELDAIKEKIEHDFSKKDCLLSYQNELINLRNKLERRVSENIQRINKIDKMSSFERKIKAAFIRNNVDTYTQIAQMCLQDVMEIVRIQIFIADYIGDPKFYIIQNNIDKFMNETVFCNNNISLMNDWATKENRNYWNDGLRKEYAQIMEQHGGLRELFTDIRNVAEEQKVDLENIIFE